MLWDFNSAVKVTNRLCSDQPERREGWACCCRPAWGPGLQKKRWYPWAEPPVERTKAWRAGALLRRTMIEAGRAMDNSGRINAAPLWISQCEAGAEMKLATGHPFDDEHGTAANGTAQLGGDLGVRCTVVCTKQNTTACQHTATRPVGEKAEVADADQAFGQNVDEEAAQELIYGDRHDLLLAAVCIVFPAKRDPIILERNQSMVGDGDAVRIASEIVQNMLGTAEWWLGVDDPVLVEELAEKVSKATWLSETLK